MSALNDRSRRLEARFLEKREKLSQLKAISEGNNIKKKKGREIFKKEEKGLKDIEDIMFIWHSGISECPKKYSTNSKLVDKAKILRRGTKENQ